MNRRAFVVATTLSLLEPRVTEAQHTGRPPKVAFVAMGHHSAFDGFSQEMRQLGYRHGETVILKPTLAGPRAIEGAVAESRRTNRRAAIVLGGSMLFGSRVEVAQLALRSRIAIGFPYREAAEAGGLLSYGPNLAELWRRSASYVHRILQGASPRDLPVEQPRKLDLVAPRVPSRSARRTDALARRYRAESPLLLHRAVSGHRHTHHGTRSHPSASWSPARHLVLDNVQSGCLIGSLSSVRGGGAGISGQGALGH